MTILPSNTPNINPAKNKPPVSDLFCLLRKARGYSSRQSLMDTLGALSRDLRQSLPFVTTLAYAYNPNEGASSRGGTHLIVATPLRQGRTVREPGDALCQPARKFWGLSCAGDGGQSDCKRCLEIAERIVGGGAK